MGKKFGKFLLCTVALSATVAAAYYYFVKKDPNLSLLDEEDLDDFDEDLDADLSPRNYVPLNNEISDSAVNYSQDDMNLDKPSNILSEEKEGNTEETIEEFFDDEDDDDSTVL